MTVDIQRLRTARLIQEQIALLIVTGKIKDPRVDSLLSIRDVTLAADYGSARVKVSGFGSQGHIQKAVAGLNHAAGFIQSQLKKKIHSKQTPVLTFELDDSIRAGDSVNRRIDRLFADANDEE